MIIGHVFLNKKIKGDQHFFQLQKVKGSFSSKILSDNLSQLSLVTDHSSTVNVKHNS